MERETGDLVQAKAPIQRVQNTSGSSMCLTGYAFVMGAACFAFLVASGAIPPPHRDKSQPATDELMCIDGWQHVLDGSRTATVVWKEVQQVGSRSQCRLIFEDDNGCRLVLGSWEKRGQMQFGSGVDEIIPGDRVSLVRYDSGGWRGMLVRVDKETN